MHKAVLRKVAGSVVVALPRALLDQLQIGASSTVGISVEGDRILLKPERRPRYSLAELIDSCDESVPASPDEDWTSGAPAGRELL